MSTDVRIERLVLDGLELSRRERDALGPAIARELRRLASAAGQRGRPARATPAPGTAARPSTGSRARSPPRSTRRDRATARPPAAGPAGRGRRG